MSAAATAFLAISPKFGAQSMSTTSYSASDLCVSAERSLLCSGAKCSGSERSCAASAVSTSARSRWAAIRSRCPEPRRSLPSTRGGDDSSAVGSSIASPVERPSYQCLIVLVGSSSSVHSFWVKNETVRLACESRSIRSTL